MLNNMPLRVMVLAESMGTCRKQRDLLQNEFAPSSSRHVKGICYRLDYS